MSQPVQLAEYTLIVRLLLTWALAVESIDSVESGSAGQPCVKA
jgi:hypothetical protein